jgi:hypothetical protein
MVSAIALLALVANSTLQARERVRMLEAFVLRPSPGRKPA